MKKPSSECKNADELFECNLKGCGPVSLGNMDDALLETLCQSYKIDPVPELKAERVKALLRARRPTSPLASNAPSDTALVTTSEVFAPKRHELTVLAFNSHKLRIERAGLQEQWLAFVRFMSTVDVVLLSEVPAGDARGKTQALVGLLQQLSDDGETTWSWEVSEPSGPGNPEVHVALVRHPIEIMGCTTTCQADGVQMDHSPFVVKLRDARFSVARTLVLTSVHFPPASRKEARDNQMRAFFASYPREAGMRTDEPFTEKGAKDARKCPVIHVVAGDFNAYPAEVCDLASLGWSHPLVGSKVATSAGRKSFDHFVPSAYTAAAFNLKWDVLELNIPQNSRRSQIGLSDHDPIVLTIREMRSTSTFPAISESDSTVCL